MRRQKDPPEGAVQAGDLGIIDVGVIRVDAQPLEDILGYRIPQEPDTGRVGHLIVKLFTGRCSIVIGDPFPDKVLAGMRQLFYRLEDIITGHPRGVRQGKAASENGNAAVDRTAGVDPRNPYERGDGRLRRDLSRQGILYLQVIGSTRAGTLKISIDGGRVTRKIRGCIQPQGPGLAIRPEQLHIG